LTASTLTLFVFIGSASATGLDAFGFAGFSSFFAAFNTVLMDFLGMLLLRLLALATATSLTAAALVLGALLVLLLANPAGATGLNAFGLPGFSGFFAAFNTVLMDFLGMLQFGRFLTSTALTTLGLPFLGGASFFISGLLFHNIEC